MAHKWDLNTLKKQYEASEKNYAELLEKTASLTGMENAEARQKNTRNLSNLAAKMHRLGEYITSFDALVELQGIVDEIAEYRLGWDARISWNDEHNWYNAGGILIGRGSLEEALPQMRKVLAEVLANETKPEWIPRKGDKLICTEEFDAWYKTTRNYLFGYAVGMEMEIDDYISDRVIGVEWVNTKHGGKSALGTPFDIVAGMRKAWVDNQAK